jgi:hypothetical protein
MITASSAIGTAMKRSIRSSGIEKTGYAPHVKPA